MRNLAFPLCPRYIHCSTRIYFKYLNSTDSIKLICRQNLMQSLESLALSYSRVGVETFSCKGPSYCFNFHVVILAPCHITNTMHLQLR
jgi:hypothetical protein